MREATEKPTVTESVFITYFCTIIRILIVFFIRHPDDSHRSD